MGNLACLLLLALVGDDVPAEPATRSEAHLVRSEGKLNLYLDGKTVPAELSASFNKVAAAPGGRRWLLHQSPKGALGYLGKDRSKVIEVSSHAEDPQWSPSGDYALFKSATGVLMLFAAISPQTPPTTVVSERVWAATFSPDSRRIAFSTDSGLYVTDLEGMRRRCLVRNRVANSVAWHPDGRSIAFSEGGLGGQTGKVLKVGLGGQKVEEVGRANLREIRYSPSGAYLLGQTAGGYAVMDGRGIVKPVPKSVDRPVWIGSKKLLLASEKQVEVWRADTGAVSAIHDQKLANVIAWTADDSPEFTNDMLFPDPFGKARRPDPGQIRAYGIVGDSNPLDDEYVLEVDSVMDSAGNQRFFAQPIVQPIKLSDQSRLTDGKAYQALRSIDLIPDTEAVLYLKGERLYPQGKLEIEEGFAPTLKGDMIIPLKGAPRLQTNEIIHGCVSPEIVTVPLVFPVSGPCRWSDTFLADRAGGARRHHGQDLMADKMTPMVACFDGTIHLGSGGPGGHYTIRILGDNGWIANYYHVNNDTPGTDDGRGGDANAFAPGLQSGQRVYVGQFIGFVGDSGNAEGTPPHLHFELWDSMTRRVVNAAPSLRVAQKLASPTVRLVDPNLKPGAGEVRLDGFVKQIDPIRRVLRAQLLSRTSNGKSQAISKPESVWLTWTQDLNAHLLGNDSVPVTFEDMRPGLYVCLVGKPPVKASAMVPRKVAFSAE